MEIKDRKGFIFDIDGTLYSQEQMRVKMLLRLLGHYCIRPHKLWELYAVYQFRKLREKSEWKQASFDELYKEIEKHISKPPAQIANRVQYWLFEAPLDVLRECAYQEVAEFINAQHEEGKQIIIYSDYPGKDKLGAIGIEYDLLFDFGQNGISEQKPSMSIMKKILSESGLQPSELLYVGDRDDRDKASAELVSIPYCDISLFRKTIHA